MDKFNPEAKCPKCGGDDINTHHCKGGGFSWQCNKEQSGEHLHRDCRRCHYGWLEACLN